MAADHELGVGDEDGVVAVFDDVIPEIEGFVVVAADEGIHLADAEGEEAKGHGLIGIAEDQEFAFFRIFIDAVDLFIGMVPGVVFVDINVRIKDPLVDEEIEGTVVETADALEGIIRCKLRLQLGVVVQSHIRLSDFPPARPASRISTPLPQSSPDRKGTDRYCSRSIGSGPPP